MDALERYYREYAMGHLFDGNYIDFDLSADMEHERIGKILEAGYMTEDDVRFVRDLLPDIPNDCIRDELREYLDSLE